MPAAYRGKYVIGASFYCTITTCLLFLLGMIFIPLGAYGAISHVLGGVTIVVFIPQFALGIAVIYLYIYTTLRDPGIMPKRIL